MTQPGQSPPGQTKLRQIVVEAVFRRKPVFFTTVAVVMALVLALTLLMHRQYRADAKLMVQNVRSNTQLSANTTEHITSQDEVSQSEINSEVDLLQSPLVARRALGTATSGVQSKRTENEITELKRRLTVEAVHQTSLINLSYLADSPEHADRGLQKVIDAYFETRSNNERASGAAEFFDRQLEEARRQLDEAQQAITNYGLKNDISDLDEEKRLQLMRVSALQDQIAQNDAALALQRSRQQRQQEQLASTPQRSKTMERTITNQYSQERLNTSLVELENRRAELVRRYAPSDRQILELDDKISNTRLAISDASNKPASENATDVNPVWQQLNAAVTMSTGELSGYAAQRATLRHLFELAQNRLDELEKSTGNVNSLKRNLQQAQADYELYSKRKSDARVSAQLDKEKLFDVSLVQPPYSTNDPTRPKPLLYTVTGLAFAVMLGTLLAVYADTSSGMIYTPGQLDTLTGTRTLATLAEVGEGGSEHMNSLEYRRLLFNIRKSVKERASDSSGSILPMVDTPHGEWPRGYIPDAAYCIALTSAMRHEGVSYVTSHLAEQASKQFGSQVAVVNTRDMLRRFEENRGLTFGLKRLEPQGYWIVAAEDDHTIIGREIGSRGSFATRLAPWLDRARQEMDLILLDCPSNLESTLATEVENCVDGYIAVVAAGLVRKPAVDQLGTTLNDRQAPMLGYVLNRRSYPLPRWLHRLI